MSLALLHHFLDYCSDLQYRNVNYMQYIHQLDERSLENTRVALDIQFPPTQEFPLRLFRSTV